MGGEGGGLSIPASPPPEVVRAVRGCSAACIVMLGGNAIGDVDTSKIIQRLISLDTVMESHGTTMVVKPKNTIIYLNPTLLYGYFARY